MIAKFDAVVTAMAYIVHVPDETKLRAEGFGSVAQIPCIFGPGWGYNAEGSRYLRERAKSEWASNAGDTPAFASRRGLTPQSIRTLAYALCNFLEWCESRGLAWEDASYVHDLVDGFQGDMLSGRWASSKQGLKPATVNLRVQEACNFLQWAAHRNLRAAFDVTKQIRRVSVGSAQSSHGHRSLQVASRVGRVRPHPLVLRIPSDQEVSAWLKSVSVEKGATKALICELVVHTGIRREEAVQWRKDTLPDDEGEWQVTGEFVSVLISYGAKGPKYRDERGDERGPSRLVMLPLDFARRLARYKDLVRPGLRATYVRAAPDVVERRQRMAKPDRRLFLSDFSGEPISAQSLYEAWTGASVQPFLGWSPHAGRHYWACQRLLKGIRSRMMALGMARANVVTGDWITGAAMDDIRLFIQPQLGHVGVQTIDSYLVWLQRAFTLTDMSDLYATHLESFDVLGEPP